MSITLSQAVSQRAILSIERYFAEHMDEQVGERMANMAAGALLVTTAWTEIRLKTCLKR